MAMQIEPYNARHLDAVVRLSLRAWAPVFESIQNAMDPELYAMFYAQGWRKSQHEAVEAACRSDDMHVWVAVDADAVVGFTAIKLDEESKLGEIYMIAVDPDAQRRGIAAALTEFALNWMREQGMTIAMVETGADPGHAPARRTYERSGFKLWPAARYFKKL